MMPKKASGFHGYSGHAGRKTFPKSVEDGSVSRSLIIHCSHSSFILQELHKNIGWQELMQAQFITLNFGISSVFVDLCPFLHHGSSGPGGQNGMGWRIIPLSSGLIQKSFHL